MRSSSSVKRGEDCAYLMNEKYETHSLVHSICAVLTSLHARRTSRTLSEKDSKPLSPQYALPAQASGPSPAINEGSLCWRPVDYIGQQVRRARQTSKRRYCCISLCP